MLVQILLNVHLDPKAHRHPFTLDEVMEALGHVTPPPAPPPRPSVEDLRQRLGMLSEFYGGSNGQAHQG